MRRLALVAVAAVVLATACVPPPRATPRRTPIRGSAVATLSQARQWAANNGAPAWFVDLANIYWREGPSRGGVRADIGYAQAAKETGFGRFGGSVDASFRNPCGLKTTSGGPDGSGSSHQRFPDWTTGVRACLDHLALYAGSPGYPRAGSPDPRHFSSIWGDAPFVQWLGTRWAPSQDYGISIVRDYLGPMGRTRTASTAGTADAAPTPTATTAPPVTTTTAAVSAPETTTTTAPPLEPVPAVPAVEPTEPGCPDPAAEPGWETDLVERDDGEIWATLRHPDGRGDVLRAGVIGIEGLVLEEEVEVGDDGWHTLVPVTVEELEESQHVIQWGTLENDPLACAPLDPAALKEDNQIDDGVDIDTSG